MSMANGNSPKRRSPASAMLEFLASTDDLSSDEVRELLTAEGVNMEQFHAKAERQISVLVNRRRLAQAKEAVRDTRVVRPQLKSRGLTRDELVELIRQWADRMSARGVAVPAFNYREFDESSTAQVESILNEIEEAARAAGITEDES